MILSQSYRLQGFMLDSNNNILNPFNIFYQVIYRIKWLNSVVEYEDSNHTRLRWQIVDANNNTPYISGTLSFKIRFLDINNNKYEFAISTINYGENIYSTVIENIYLPMIGNLYNDIENYWHSFKSRGY